MFRIVFFSLVSFSLLGCAGAGQYLPEDRDVINQAVID
jgi:hypothetical protein